ncbi:MAG: hypothetical protein JO023_28940 [Chloroflexi bacterium]|nr:hypothetical protein [Chloroflexota bacterium]
MVASPAIAPTRLTVLDPTGYPPKVVGKQLAPRLDTLDGKKIYLVDCRFDDSDIFLAQLQAWFTEHLPNTRTEIIGLTSVYTRDDPETWERIKADGDGAVVGVGH